MLEIVLTLPEVSHGKPNCTIGERILLATCFLCFSSHELSQRRLSEVDIEGSKSEERLSRLVKPKQVHNWEKNFKRVTGYGEK